MKKVSESKEGTSKKRVYSQGKTASAKVRKAHMETDGDFPALLQLKDALNLNWSQAVALYLMAHYNRQTVVENVRSLVLQGVRALYDDCRGDTMMLPGHSVDVEESARASMFYALVEPSIKFVLEETV